MPDRAQAERILQSGCGPDAELVFQAAFFQHFALFFPLPSLARLIISGC
jgi:hypothetical protein